MTSMITRIFRHNLGIVLVATLVLSFSLVSAISDRGGTTQVTSTNHVDLNGVNVAIFYGEGTLASSAVALRNMFLWMNATAEFVNGTQIREGILSTYHILVFPGGSAVLYQGELGDEGLDVIRAFVSNGGSYFGICGGSLFATNVVLGLFDGWYSSSINGSEICLTTMFINRNSAGPDLSAEPESYRTMYWGSAYFYGEDMSNIIPIANYTTNQSGMIAFRYGDGTAFLSSPHPEYEEGDFRDGTSFGDYLNDPDSEWPLMLKVSCWLVDASITQTTSTTQATSINPTTSNQTTESTTQFTEYLMLLTIGGSSLIVIVIVVMLLRSKTRR